MSRGFTIWLTGLSGAGKTTLANLIAQRLREDVGLACVVLDGDELRRTVSSDLGFSMRDRAENVRRASQFSALLCRQGTVSVVALISPSIAARDAARATHPPGGFVEVHVATPLHICEQRDPKGLYQLARAGKISDFTGVQSPYEAPDRPEIRVGARAEAPAHTAARVLRLLSDLGLLGGSN